MSIATRLMSGSLLLSGGRIVTNGLAAVSMIVLARLLTPEDFGLVAIATSVMMVLRAVTELAMSQAVIRLEEPTRDHLDTAWTLGLIRGLIIVAVMCALAWPLAQIYGDERLGPLVIVISLALLFSSLVNPRQALLLKELVFWQSVTVLIVGRLVGIAASITIAIVYQSYWALVLGTVIGEAVSMAFSYVILPYLPRFSLRSRADLLSFSVWLTLRSFVNTLNWRFDQLLVGAILGKATLGQYAVGSNLAQLPTRETIIPITGALFPGLVKINQDGPRLRSAYQRAQSLISLAAIPAGVGLALIAEPFVVLFMGEKWLPAVIVIQALSAVFALQTIGSFVNSVAMAKGKTKRLFVRDLQLLCFRLPVITVAMIMFGLIGLVYSRVLTGLVGIAVNMFLVKELIDIKIRDQILVNGRALCAAILMIVCVLGFQMWLSGFSELAHRELVEIAGSVAVGVCSYCASVFLFWRLQNYPEGPEKLVLNLCKQGIDRIKRSPSTDHKEEPR